MKGTVFGERYRLVDFIGQGGMSMVYRAVDIRTGHSVAIKILKSEYNGDKEFLERFQREAQAASLMSHHNIVNLLDVGVEGDCRYLVLEYVSGSTLKEIIQKKGKLHTNTAIQITIRILSALQHAHDNGIIHRDIKPQNVLINTDGHVKVADFGIARMANAFTISKGDTVVGSVHYSSPEQASGNVVEATSDLYSTGVVLYEMLTGHVPFVGDTPVSVAMQHINATPPPIAEANPDVPLPVIAVVMRALEKSPKKRYQNAREMADALVRAREGKYDPNTPLPGERQAAEEAAQQRQAGAARKGAPGQTARQTTVQKRRNRTSVFTVITVILVLVGLIAGSVTIYHSVTGSTVAPDLVGLTVEEAQALVKRAGLNWQQTEINHDKIAEGTVISQTPEAEAEMRKGDSVVVAVSLGPTQIITPNVTGLTRDEAAAKLKEKGLSMVVSKSPSTEPVDTVIAQNPEADEPCSAGQEIEITLSGGSTLVPDVTGQAYADAVQQLKENNLVAGKVVYGDAAEDQIGKVLEQSPASGTMAVLDTQVTLTIGAKSKPYHAELDVNIPESTTSVPLRVTLVENGEEAEQYSGMTTAGAAYSVIIPVSSSLSGSLTCRAYLNGEMILEREVSLE